MADEERTTCLELASVKVAEEWKKLIDTNFVLQQHMYLHLNLKKCSNEFVEVVIEILKRSTIPKDVKFNDIKLKYRRQMLSSLAPYVHPELDKDFLMNELRKIFNKWIGDEDNEFVFEKINKAEWYPAWHCMVYICKPVGHTKCSKQKLEDIEHLQIYKDFCDSQDPPLDYAVGAVRKKKSRYIPNGKNRGRPKKQRVEGPQPQLAQSPIDDDDDFKEYFHEGNEGTKDSDEVPLQNLDAIVLTSDDMANFYPDDGMANIYPDDDMADFLCGINFLDSPAHSTLSDFQETESVEDIQDKSPQTNFSAGVTIAEIRAARVACFSRV